MQFRSWNDVSWTEHVLPVPFVCTTVGCMHVCMYVCVYVCIHIHYRHVCIIGNLCVCVCVCVCELSIYCSLKLILFLAYFSACLTCCHQPPIEPYTLCSLLPPIQFLASFITHFLPLLIFIIFYFSHALIFHFQIPEQNPPLPHLAE